MPIFPPSQNHACCPTRNTVSLRTLYPCQQAGTVPVTRAEADVVHTSKIVSPGSLVGQVEKLMPVLLQGDPPQSPPQFNLTD